MRERALVIDDDAMLVRFLRRGLEQAGYNVTTAGTISEAQRRASETDPEIVLLDLMLPDGDGAALCRELRRDSDRLILVLSAKREVADRIQLLDLGADDYLVKPFAFAELAAHLRALKRRARADGQPVLRCGDLSLDIDGGRTWRDGRELALTPTEQRLLLLLLRNKGRALDEEAIATHLWGDRDAAATSNRVEVHVHRLRSKLQVPAEVPLLHTLGTTDRGALYVLRDPP